TVLYVGVTNNLVWRLHQHVNGLTKGFTSKYNCHYLVCYEKYDQITDAIAREKEIKGWRREKKEQLINSFNPEWRFLNDEIS
ncbi:MAG: GIY-YIG nuclease family protein, partial [Bacteroidia bacterium]